MSIRSTVCTTFVLALLSIAACGPTVTNGNIGGDGGARPPDASGPAVCGDGVVSGAETCDQNCPTTCAPQVCGVPTLVGSPATCDVACHYDPITMCVGGDGCCPAGCDLTSDSDCTGIRIDSFYAGYTLQDLGAVPGVPPKLGGLNVKAGDPTKLLIGGDANTDAGALYEIGVTRDASMHIIGFSGTGTKTITAAFNDGGVIYGPGGIMFLARWPSNELGEVMPGSVVTDKVLPLASLGVASAMAGDIFVPAGYPGAGQLKVTSWPDGQWYTFTIAANAMGLYDVSAAAQTVTLGGGPEGMVYHGFNIP